MSCVAFQEVGNGAGESPSVLFREEQRFTQTWLWVLVVAVAAASVGAAAVALADDDGWRWVAVVLGVLVGVGVPLLLLVARLKVEVFADRVDIRYRPFLTRTVPLDAVVSATAVTYRPLRDYGGWGIKGWSRRKIAYNVSGNRGVLLALADGRTVLIGSRRPDELSAAISRGLARVT